MEPECLSVVSFTEVESCGGAVAEDQKLRTGIMEDVILQVGQTWRL